jgi:uncharacterized membrane protein
MMSQNRQDAKDRLRSELDYEVNRRAAADIQGLARKLNLLGEHVSDLEDLIRDKQIAKRGAGGTSWSQQIQDVPIDTGNHPAE